MNRRGLKQDGERSWFAAGSGMCAASLVLSRAREQTTTLLCYLTMHGKVVVFCCYAVDDGVQTATLAAD